MAGVETKRYVVHRPQDAARCKEMGAKISHGQHWVRHCLSRGLSMMRTVADEFKGDDGNQPG